MCGSGRKYKKCHLPLKEGYIVNKKGDLLCIHGANKPKKLTAIEGKVYWVCVCGYKSLAKTAEEMEVKHDATGLQPEVAIDNGEDQQSHTEVSEG
jgi:hypothetical protein